MKEKRNGINYENGLPSPTNGGWSQTIAYLLEQINNNSITNNEQLVQAIQSISGNTQTNETPTLTLIETKYLEGNVELELYNPHPITTPTPQVRVEQRTVQPAPQIIKIPNKDLYTKCCGAYEPIQSTYVKCMDRVDTCYNKIKEAKGYVEPGDITASTIKMSDCGC
jgi:hypothetical protein